MPEAEQPDERKNKEEDWRGALGESLSVEQLAAQLAKQAAFAEKVQEFLREHVGATPSAAATSATAAAAAAAADAATATAALESAAPTAYGSDMTDRINERIAKLEGAFEHAFEGIRHGQNITLAAVAGVGASVLAVGAILAALMLYALQRIDNLPNEFNSLTQTLSSAITAAKQQAPQVILIPAPQVPPTAPAPAPEPKNP